MGRKRMHADDTIRMIRWLVDNTPLSYKEISYYMATYHNINLNYYTVRKIILENHYDNVIGSEMMPCPHLEKYICLLYSGYTSSGCL
jgi:hypothetical protein